VTLKSSKKWLVFGADTIAHGATVQLTLFLDVFADVPFIKV